MKLLVRALAALAILVGIVFSLQGIDLLGGSPMSGQSEWAWAGATLLVLGALLLLWSFRKASPR